jgi:hypothetical protein
MRKKVLITCVLCMLLLAGAAVLYLLFVSNGSESSNISKIGNTNGNLADNSNNDFVENTGNASLEGGGAGSSGGSGTSADLTADTESSAEQGGRGAFLTKDSQSTGDRHICANLDLSACSSQLESVCGWFNQSRVSCTEGPCVKRYVTECFACNDVRVVYWTEGECPFHG